MKLSVILALQLFIGAVFALPAHHRWSLVPDSEGRIHLVDLNPFDIQQPEPQWNPDDDVFFLLFTRSNPTIGQRITFSVPSILESNWNSAATGTRFLIHGWLGDHTAMINTDLTPAHLAAADHNVIVVDWGAGAGAVYQTARGRVPEVAVVVARFIDFLHLNGFLVEFNRLVINGHSLGAHLAGITGKRITRGRAQAIFGLDPAGDFPLDNPDERFAEDDAVYTELLATDTWRQAPIAHANFYPNWGFNQPGCTTGICSHMRVIGFMAESIISDRFVGRRCSNFQQILDQNCPTGQGTAGIMGGNAAKNLAGIFVLETNPNTPFAQG